MIRVGDRCRIIDPCHNASGATGCVERRTAAKIGWPGDLLCLSMTDGKFAGQDVYVFSHRCEVVTQNPGGGS